MEVVITFAESDEGGDNVIARAIAVVYSMSVHIQEFWF